jgi:hypothetical protein
MCVWISAGSKIPMSLLCLPRPSNYVLPCFFLPPNTCTWAETNDCCPAQLLLLAANTSRSKNPNETEQALTVVFLSVQSSVLPFQLHCPCVAATQRHEAVSLQRWVLPLHSPSPSWLLLLPPECARTLLLPPH